MTKTRLMKPYIPNGQKKTWFWEYYKTKVDTENLKKLIEITDLFFCNTIEIIASNSDERYYIKINYYSAGSFLHPRVNSYNDISCLILPNCIILIHVKTFREIFVVKFSENYIEKIVY